MVPSIPMKSMAPRLSVTVKMVQMGEQGPQGEQGETGAQGEQGVPGEAGADAEPCTAVDNGDGTYTITCPDGTSVTLSDGSQGPQGEQV